MAGVLGRGRVGVCDRREASHKNFRRVRAKFRIDAIDVIEIDRGNSGERRDSAAKDVRM